MLVPGRCAKQHQSTEHRGPCPGGAHSCTSPPGTAAHAREDRRDGWHRGQPWWSIDGFCRLLYSVVEPLLHAIRVSLYCLQQNAHIFTGTNENAVIVPAIAVKKHQKKIRMQMHQKHGQN